MQLSNDRVISFMGDGTFWHSGLTTSFANASYNNQDAVMVIFENGWTSMTGQQENPASGKNHRGEDVPSMKIDQALKATGVKWIEPFSWDVEFSKRDDNGVLLDPTLK